MAKPPSLLSLSAALLAVLGGAQSSGLLVRDAEARVLQAVVRRRDEEESHEELLVVAPRNDAEVLIAGHRSHSSHSSHRSHASHSSHYSGNSGYGGGSTYVPAPAPRPVYVPPPRKPKAATVSFVAFPGGKIFVDDKAVGVDATTELKLAAGKHQVRIENQFLGSTTIDVELTEAQTGVIKLEW
jgi:hypothetical protein